VKRTAWLVAVVVAACTPAHGPMVIVGATAQATQGPVADSVVIIDGPSVASIGTRVATPIPKGARLVDGKGKWLVATSGALAPGSRADLLLLDGDPGDRRHFENPRLVIVGGEVKERR
jgi:imidazolonepropionase-like amidohydrolase